MDKQGKQEKQDHSDEIVDKAVAEGGAYEVIRQRLLEYGRQLESKTEALNQARLEEFGSSDMKVAARVRVRTENNCVARDIVQVGELLLFGYNVFIGLKKETLVEDVFSLFRVQDNGSGYEMEPVTLTGSFLSDSGFSNDFTELYRYYKHARLVELTLKEGKLLAGFQIGERTEDIRVFRWAVSADGKDVKYIDNRGERDIQLPPAFDFEWQETSREDFVHGRHPHINILDTVFVETTGGDLTVKVEDNTEDGLGIYREPVDDATQSLDDADLFYAAVGELILMKVRPYREEAWRYLIFNTVTQEVLRIDAVGESCVQLPEDHGIVFPGGYYLQTGEYKTFDGEAKGLKFQHRIRSPNGEDVLYVFYEPEAGVVGLLAYNLIDKTLQNPIYGHGYALFEDGKIVIFSAEGDPTRIHPMQIWETPYVSQEYAGQAPVSHSFFGRIGNAELVRGVSDLYSIVRIINNQSVSARLYEELTKAAAKTFDAYYWIEEPETQGIAGILKEIGTTSEQVIDEFEKVESIRQQSAKTMAEAEREQDKILASLRPDNWETAEDYVNALDRLRHQQGHLTTIREYRYIDLERIDALNQGLTEAQNKLNGQTVEFLSGEQALKPYLVKVDELNSQVEKADAIAVLDPLIDTIESTVSGLDLLSELMNTLTVQDARIRTRIIDGISEVYAKLNQCRAHAKHKQKSLGSEEAIAQFSAQFKLFSQSIAHALGRATTPERCDEQLSRLLVQLEELESQFSNFDQFLADIMEKREELYESFESHKQQLLDERQRKAQAISDAADRILASIERRSLKFTETDDLNTYFASDALVTKTQELIAQLHELDSTVKADDVDARFKSIKEQAQRSLRDKSDIYEDGGKVIKLGPRHKFNVNTQELDLTIIPRNGELTVHLTGTDYFETIRNPELIDLRQYWEVSIESEDTDVYRAEYLAASIISETESGNSSLDSDTLHGALQDDDALIKIVREFAAPRYKEGYEKGIHDHDATLILKALLPALERADLLRYTPLCRGLGQVFWARLQHPKKSADQPDNSPSTWPERAQSAAQMRTAFSSAKATELLEEEVYKALSDFLQSHPIPVSDYDRKRTARYLVSELSRDRVEFISSKYARRLADELKRALDENTWRLYQAALANLNGKVTERWKLSTAWLQALVDRKGLQTLQRYIPEAVALINSEERLGRRDTEIDLELEIPGLLGDHPIIENRQLSFAVDAFLQRLENHRQNAVPGYHRYLQIRQQIIDQERNSLRLQEFKPKPLSSFVRNRLINEAYLPVIGDNLAKQMGAAGDSKRTDLMGLLMMISPPGYGKTTLMEYVASRLGLIFMKINCPSLGHNVLSLDPDRAPNATARQELEKLNLALEMGNNVMLYLDDIQHTHPEFLQKFISLCDGTRRIEGVWKGQTKTYDMRGRKFCVIMAGNPYTESGESFKVPDMLANRADIYNLGDILGGMDEQFALSYIENCLTSNPVLAPLATREMDDVYKLIHLAKGMDVATTDLSHQYSGAEINEIKAILKTLFVVQDTVLKINQQYIASAAQDDKYRTEPAFKLQGSYRNMNKMAEKVSAVMNESELHRMISDHYLGEAQLLTSGAEENLLKLAEIRGVITKPEMSRWQEILNEFQRQNAMGDDTDAASKVVGQLFEISRNMGLITDFLDKRSPFASESNQSVATEEIHASLRQVTDAIQKIQYNVEVVNQPVPGIDILLKTIADTFENSIFPLVRAMEGKLNIDLKTQENMASVFSEMRGLRKHLESITQVSGTVIDGNPEA